MEIRRNLRSRENRRVHWKILISRESVGNVRQVERGDERERAPDVQSDVGVSVVVSARVTTANDQLVATTDPTHEPVITGSWIPVEAKSRFKVIRITTRDRPHTETRITAGSSKHWIVKLNQILNRLAGVFVTQTGRQRKIGFDLPLVLTVEVEVVPIEMQHARNARQVSIDLNVGEIVYKVIQIRIDEVAAGCWFEELMQLAAMNINSKFPTVITGRVRQIVLDLVSVSNRSLRKICCQTNRGARGARVEARHSEVSDLNRRNRLSLQIRSHGRTRSTQIREPQFVDHLRTENAVERDIHALVARDVGRLVTRRC